MADSEDWATAFFLIFVFWGGKLGYDAAGFGGVILGCLVGGVAGFFIPYGLGSLFDCLLARKWHKAAIVSVLVASLAGLTWYLWGVR